MGKTRGAGGFRVKEANNWDGMGALDGDGDWVGALFLCFAGGEERVRRRWSVRSYYYGCVGLATCLGLNNGTMIMEHDIARDESLWLFVILRLCLLLFDERVFMS